MANDATYQPGVVQIRQNGDLAVVTGTSATIETGGGLTIESGGAFTAASGSTLTLSGSVVVGTGGQLEVQTGGSVSMPVATGTSAAGFPAYGVTIINTTAADLAFSLAAPSTPGIFKLLCNTIHGATTIAQTVKLTGCVVYGGSSSTAGTSVISFFAPSSLALVSVSTIAWALACPRPTADITFA